MTRKFPAASKLAMLLAAAALVALGSASASAQSKQKYDKDGRPYYGANGPNRSYQQGRAPASTSPRAPGSMPARKCCRATASSRTTRSRRRTGTQRSRAKTTIARSTASRSTRRRTWAAIRSASRCIDERSVASTKKVPGRAGHFVFLGFTRYACSFCSSFRIASPICVVEAAVVPSDLISAVRRPLASTAAIAASTLSASAPMSKE